MQEDVELGVVEILPRPEVCVSTRGSTRVVNDLVRASVATSRSSFHVSGEEISTSHSSNEMQRMESRDTRADIESIFEMRSRGVVSRMDSSDELVKRMGSPFSR